MKLAKPENWNLLKRFKQTINFIQFSRDSLDNHYHLIRLVAVTCWLTGDSQSQCQENGSGTKATKWRASSPSLVKVLPKKTNWKFKDSRIEGQRTLGEILIHCDLIAWLFWNFGSVPKVCFLYIPHLCKGKGPFSWRFLRFLRQLQTASPKPTRDKEMIESSPENW